METAMLSEGENTARPRGRPRSKTVAVKFIKSVAGARFAYAEGEVCEVVPSVAEWAIKYKFAERV